MKTKIFVLALTRYIILSMSFTVCFTACFFNIDIPTEIHVYSLSDAKKKLADYSSDGIGSSPEELLDVYVRFDIGDLSQPGNSYLRLIEIIGDSGLYVNLKLGTATMGTRVFTSPQLNEAVKGMDKIIGTTTPVGITSIRADKNGKSPFFFYENLLSFYHPDFSNKGTLTEIGDFAFSSCKNLKYIGIGYNVKTIGREAFHGCENLSGGISFDSSLITIGDKAFYDCSALERIQFRGIPPTLGESVFLGSTPSTITFSIEPEHEALYCAWLTENASKFNNEGKDIVFKLTSN